MLFIKDNTLSNMAKGASSYSPVLWRHSWCTPSSTGQASKEHDDNRQKDLLFESPYSILQLSKFITLLEVLQLMLALHWFPWRAYLIQNNLTLNREKTGPQGNYSKIRIRMTLCLSFPNNTKSSFYRRAVLKLRRICKYDQSFLFWSCWRFLVDVQTGFLMKFLFWRIQRKKVVIQVLDEGPH